MNETTLIDVVHEASPKLIYVYVFLSMWTFLVELAEIAEYESGMEYPNLMFVHGQIPENAPDKEFTADTAVESDGDYSDSDEYDELGYDELWN